MRRGLVLLACCLTWLWTGVAMAQDCTYEAEPNDAPHQANPLDRAGSSSSHAYCMTGELPGSNDQDWFLWEVDEQDAGTWWQIEAESIRGQLTIFAIYRMSFADDGVGVTAANGLFETETRDGRPITAGPFLIAPGRYHIGMTPSGGQGEYVALLRPLDALSRGSSAFQPERPLTGPFFAHGPVVDGVTQPFVIDEDGAEQVWEVGLRTSIGDRPTLRLVGPAGTVGEAVVGADGGARLTSLGLQPGAYELQIIGDAGVAQLRLQSVGRRTDGVEVEPNHTWATANIFPLESSMRGGLDGDRDVFRTEVDEAAATRAWDLLVEASGNVILDILDAEERLLQTRRGVGGITEGLHFEPGSYQVRIQGDRGVDYTLTWRAASPAADGLELEPNDTVLAATPIGPDGQVRGELTPADIDFYSYEVVGGAQLFRVQAVGEDIRDLAVFGRDGRSTVEVSGGSRLRIDDLLLLPGEHHFRVRGGDGPYALRIMPLGPAPDGAEAEGAPGAGETLLPGAAAPAEPDTTDPADPAAIAEPVGPPPPPGWMEREPNDDASRAHRLRPGEVHVGRLYGPRDEDHYRFHLSEDQFVRLELIPPEGDVSLRLNLDNAWHQPFAHEQGQPTVVERWLLAGDHQVRMAGGPDVPTGYYQLRLTLLGQLDLPPVVKPNDTPATAGLLPAELRWVSRVGGGDGDDLFHLPVFERDTALSLTVDGEAGNLSVALLLDSGTENLRGQDGVFDGTLPAGEAALLRVRGQTRYSAEIAFETAPDPAQLQPPRGEGLALEVTDDHIELAAFWHEGQTLATEVRVQNLSDAPQTVRFEAAVTQPQAVVSAPEELSLAAGESAMVPVEVSLPPDLRDDVPLLLSVAAQSEQHRAVAALHAAPLCETMPVAPALHPVWPTVLLGRLDLLWDGLGARVMEGAPTTSRDAFLLDGRTTPSRGGGLTLDHVPTFQLGGDQPVRLVGTLLHPMADGSVAQQLKGFRIETSMDGVSFTPVLEGELKAARIEQAFLFDQPVTARYARIVMLSTQGGGNTARLGEWKLLAEDAAPLGRFDLADPALGGHVVWSDRLVSNSGQALVMEDATQNPFDMQNEPGGFTFVLGFHHGRAARITELVWHESPRFNDGTGHTFFEETTVEVSLGSPIGPWIPLADWTLERDADGVARLILDEAVWARYLRFSSPQVEGQRYHWPPHLLQVFEQEAGDGYLSVLGEWGHGSKDGIYETMHPAAVAVPTVGEAAHGARESAAPLGSGEVAQGTVLVAEREAWYRITVPEGQNLLELRLSGDPDIAYLYHLEDAEGQPVAFDLRHEGETEILRLYADPGDYYLHLEEPRRSVVISWDTSGSVQPYTDITYSSLASFALGLDGDKEFAQLLAFNNPYPSWLLPFWSSEPERVQRAINDFGRTADSSNSEIALLVATQALAQREGTRAIMLMTDAETFSYNATPDLWAAFEEVRPRVFTFEISSVGGARPQDLMQNWAAVNGGVYDLTTGIGGFDAGFARASCLLRRPKAYRVEVTTEAVAPPGPGQIAVLRAAGAAQGAVQVVFDASGSMGQNLPSGEQRITAAKRVLESLVGEVLPEGAPFALRAFGHITPSSCEMSLDVPLGPLDRAQALAAVRAIEPKLLSQTPLADALAAVAGDLPAGGAGRTVILITDGVESCGGDPAAAVAALRAQGPLDLAIVSLGLGAADLAVFEALAAEVGASYVDVGSFEELEASVNAALNPAFEVLDAGGAVVARGQVDGAAVELPMGVYTVRVHGATVQEFHDVRVPGDRRVDLTLGGR